MGPLDFLNHLLNFIAPAVWVGLWVPMLARLVIKTKRASLSLGQQTAVNAAVAVMALGLGLLLFGRDGKMASYALMVLLCTASQWMMVRGWRG